MSLNTLVSHTADLLESVIFFKIAHFPLIVLWLIGACLFFSWKLNFIQFRRLADGFNMLSQPKEAGEGKITTWEAFLATIFNGIGVASLSGVLIAVARGGPGSIFWMCLIGFLSMPVKFMEVCVGHSFRQKQADGSFVVGPVTYIKKCLEGVNMTKLGVFLAFAYAVFSILDSLNGANMFQAGQMSLALSNSFNGLDSNYVRLIGGILVALASFIISSKGVAKVASFLYSITSITTSLLMIACMMVILYNYNSILPSLKLIGENIFTAKSAIGGFWGMIALCVQRSFFASTVGLGISPIFHANSKNTSHVREGLVAMIEPIFDTVLPTLIFGMTLLCSGQHLMINASDGVVILAHCLSTLSEPLKHLVTLFSFMCAFSVIISGSLVFKNSLTALLGEGLISKYSLIIFCLFTVIGSIASADDILRLADSTALAMSIPNILALYCITPKVKRELEVELRRQSQ